uniref:Uncharacterized protein n=1 Tax=Electrophorus electricus TaxID=8005 RepID=A0A4W4FZF3_ELEEL
MYIKQQSLVPTQRKAGKEPPTRETSQYEGERRSPHLSRGSPVVLLGGSFCSKGAATTFCAKSRGVAMSFSGNHFLGGSQPKQLHINMLY